MKFQLSLFIVFVFLIFNAKGLNKLLNKSSELKKPTDNGNIHSLPKSIQNVISENSAIFLQTSSKSKVHAKRKVRFLKDGRPCASVFDFNDKSYEDCTTDTAPDASNSGEEWCYVDSVIGGSPPWSFCKPVLNYDRLRERSKEVMERMVIEVSKISTMASNLIEPATKTLSNAENLMKKQAHTDTRINDMQSKIGNLQSNHILAIQGKEKSDSMIAVIKILEHDVSQLKSQNSGQKGRNPKNCEGSIGYEGEVPGDGIQAHFYDNEDFLGQPLLEVVENVDREWDNQPPSEGINFENFSVKWETWLRVPISGDYVLITEVDDGAALLLNNQPIISHFFGLQNKAKKDVTSWLDFIRHALKSDVPAPNEAKKESPRAESYPIYLAAGNKYKLTYYTYHSVANKIKDTGKVFVKLYWKSDYIPEGLIEDGLFYTYNRPNPVKAADYSHEDMILSRMLEYDNAFKDDDNFKMVDIPFHYLGYSALKQNKEFTNPMLNLTMTSPCIIYIAVDISTFDQIPDDFLDTQESMSVLEISPKVKIEEGVPVKSFRSKLYRIYQKKFSAGLVEIGMKYKEARKSLRMIVFYTLDPSVKLPASCGGKEIIISRSSGEYFDYCVQSSKFPEEGWSCESAFSGKMIDERDGVWAADGQGINSWVEIHFRGYFQVTKIEIKNRDSPSERNSRLIASFGAGNSERNLNLKNIDTPQVFDIIPPIVSNQVRLTIDDVYTTLNNGGAFNIFGVPCLDPNEEAKDPMHELNAAKNRIIPLSCEDSLVNKFEFQRLKYSADDIFSVECGDVCTFFPVLIFGDQAYAPDSSICKAAFHSGAIGKEGGVVKMKIVGGSKYYKSVFKNGIKSNSKQGTQIGVSFIAVNKVEQNLHLYVGQKLDILDQKEGKWVPGYIQSLDKFDSISATIKVGKEGFGPEYNRIIEWPDELVAKFCGDKLKDRQCPEADRNPNVPIFTNIKIAFGPPPPKAEGYLLDLGEKFGTKGTLEYGWSRAIKTLGRTRHVNSDPLLDNMMLFPPDGKSKWCTEVKPFITCESAEWSIKVPPGKYQIRGSLGDPANRVKYNVQLNNKPLISRVLGKNEFFPFKETMQILDGTITLSSRCDHDCKYSWSRVNWISIEKVLDSPKPSKYTESMSDGTERLNCGLAWRGGRCYMGGAVENCIYAKLTDRGLSGCSGKLIIVKVPEDYACKEQVGSYKCVRQEYPTLDECFIACPGVCKGTRCSITG